MSRRLVASRRHLFTEVAVPVLECGESDAL